MTATLFNSKNFFPAQFISKSYTALLAFILSTLAHSSTVFINEFHYDNIGTDRNEAVEIFGVANTLLDDWQLVFYNGNNGLVYKNILLNGLISNTNNGYGTLSFSVSGIQNGLADAIALIDNTGNVIEFISYEGELIAADGAAINMTSIDIGISETAMTPQGVSLQRIGYGQLSGDFSWSIETANFGAINSLQNISPTVVPLPCGALLYLSSLFGFGLYRKPSK